MNDAYLYSKEKGRSEALERPGLDGRQMVAVKWFGSAKADHRAAIAWEEQTKKDLRAAKKLNAEQQALIPTDSCRKKLSILEWANAYLEECERRNTLSTFKEKRDGFKRLMRYLAKTEGLSPDMPVESFGRRQARVYLAWQKDRRGPNCSNKDRKVLTTAWRWGVAYLETAFRWISPIPSSAASAMRKSALRVTFPPETDFWKVYAVAPEREQALLTCYLRTSRPERANCSDLTWDEVDFARNTVTLTTRKTRTGTVKRDEMPLNAEVRQTLLWLWENRQGASNHVFTCPVEPFIGQPYKSAAHVMKRLCKRAGVKRFGFHAIRQLAATVLAQEAGTACSASSTVCGTKSRVRYRPLPAWPWRVQGSGNRPRFLGGPRTGQGSAVFPAAG